MANHDVSNPIFNPTLRKFETTDPGHADIFNAVIGQLINNDVELAAQQSDMEQQKANNTDIARTTTDKTVTGAINELNSNKAKDTDNTRTTTSKTVTGAINELNAGKLDKNDFVSKNSYAVTTGTSTAYIATLSPAPTAYTDGMQITILPHVDCGTNPTLKANTLGSLTILNQDGSAISAGDIKANKPLSLVRVGSNFFIRSGCGVYSPKVLKWMFAKVIPHTRESGASVIYNGKIYVMGGYGGGGAGYTFPYLDIYDIATDTWSQGADLSQTFIGATAQVYNGNIYFIGGNTGSYRYGKVYIYNIASNTWSTGTSMPDIGEYISSVLYNGKIYCVGGIGNSYNSLYIYDIASNTWSQGANIINGRWGMGTTLYNGKMYCIGGYWGTQASLSFCEIYDIASNTWSSGATMTTSLAFSSAVIYNGKIYCVAGFSGIAPMYVTNYIVIYDIASNTYTLDTSMRNTRVGVSCQIYKNNIYVISGGSAQTSSGDCYNYNDVLILK